MIHRGRNSRHTTAPGSVGSDTDALQTDVMRFMSILALCLMAVFALVQSLPPQIRSDTRPEPAREALEQDLGLQQQRAQALQAELDRVTALTRRTQARDGAARRALSTAQEQLRRIVDQTAQARSERERLAAELKRLNRELAHSRAELADIRRAADNEAHSMRELQQRLAEARKTLAALSQRTAELRARQQVEPPPPVPPTAPSPAPAAAQQGFTLRFASDGALEQLVASGAVSLYAMAGKQAWRLSLGRDGPAFAPDTTPAWFHEMEPSTVPASYGHALAESVSRPDALPMVWGVQLPPTTRQGIASLTRGLAGGELVIGADGQVSLEAE